MPSLSTRTADSFSLELPAAPLTPPIRTGPGRPTLYEPEIVAAICTRIRDEGVSDSAAGYLSGVTSSTLSRWKQQYEEVEFALGHARAQFDLNCLRALRTARKRDGTLDWRSQAWLLRHSSPEGYGPPSRRRKVTAEPAPATPPPASLEPTVEEQIAALSAELHRAQAEEASAIAATASILPEIHRSPRTARSRLDEPPAPPAGQPRASITNRAILPEITTGTRNGHISPASTITNCAILPGITMRLGSGEDVPRGLLEATTGAEKRGGIAGTSGALESQRELIAVLIEENEELRAQLRDLIPQVA